MNQRTTRATVLRIAGSAILAAGLLVCAGAAGAQVYRWTDSHGVVHYSDKPHTRNEQPAKLPALQSFDPAAHGDPLVDNGKAAQTPAAPAPAGAAPRIVHPADGATIRDAQNRVTVSVAAAALKVGQGFVYYVDGKARNTTPTQAASMELAPVWRGKHHISVALVDHDGRVVSRSTPITVYMKQPTVHH